MAFNKALVLVLALAAVGVATVSGRELKQVASPLLPTPLAAQVTFFDDSYSGGSQTFDVDLPATGCSACVNLNLIRTNSWESFLSSAGTSINLYDDRNCGGTTGLYPARSSVIKGSLSNSVDSFTLCA